MKRMQITLTLTGVFLALVGTVGFAQSDPQPATQPNQQGQTTNRDMMMNDGMVTNPEQWKQWRQHMGMTDQMMARCSMIINAGVSPTDPAVVLAEREQLKLTEEQVQQIERIAEKARQQTKAVLTDSQQQQLREIGDQPRSMMQMHNQMMQRWHQRMQQINEQDRSTIMMGCPMNMMMHEAVMPDQPAATQPGDRSGSDQQKGRMIKMMPCCPRMPGRSSR